MNHGRTTVVPRKGVLFFSPKKGAGSKDKAREKNPAPDKSLERLQGHGKGPRINPIYENVKNYVEYLSLRL